MSEKESRPKRPKTAPGTLSRGDLLAVAAGMGAAWKALEATGQRLEARVTGADIALPAWCYGTEGPSDARAEAIRMYLDVFFKGAGLGVTTTHRAGILAAHPSTIEAVHTFNAAKDAVIAVIYEVSQLQQKDLFLAAWDQLGRPEDAPLPRLHLKQLRRHVTVLDERIASVGWCWTKRKADYPEYEWSDIRNELTRNSDRPGSETKVKEDLERLQQFPAEAKFVKVREGSVYLMTNGSWRDEETGELRRWSSVTPMPIIVPKTTLPVYRPLTKAPADARFRRRLTPSHAIYRGDFEFPSIEVYLKREKSPRH